MTPETFDQRRARLMSMPIRGVAQASESFEARRQRLLSMPIKQPRAQASKPVEPVPGSVWTVEPWDLEEAIILRRGGVVLRYLGWRYGLDPRVIEARLKAANPKG